MQSPDPTSPITAPLQALAVVEDFEGLVLALRDRRHALKISQNVLDDLTGLPDGYVAKVELSATNPASKSSRSIGKLSLAEMLRALSLKLVLVDDGSADRLRRVPAPKVEGQQTLIAPPVRDMRSLFIERSRKGGEATRDNRTPEERKAAARRAARARWANHSKKERKNVS